jgi:hypothetical protein
MSQMYPNHTLAYSFFKASFFLSFRLRLCLPAAVFLSGFTIKPLKVVFVTPVYASCPAHYTVVDSILIVSGKESKLWIPSLCSVLPHSAVTFSV